MTLPSDISKNAMSAYLHLVKHLPLSCQKYGKTRDPNEGSARPYRYYWCTSKNSTHKPSNLPHCHCHYQPPFLTSPPTTTTTTTTTTTNTTTNNNNNNFVIPLTLLIHKTFIVPFPFLFAYRNTSCLPTNFRLLDLD